MSSEQVFREDGEIVGVVHAHDGGFRSCTVFGHPLHDAADADEARRHLREKGLAVLAERWELDDGDGPVAVRLVEVAPDAVTVAPEYPGPVPRTLRLTGDDLARLRLR
ncbi:hypothetical protein [Pseudonocardia spirodelae]|uniref:Uncharacterized protein n=1 Tax=Pseudonocardia spirodelae TaxID=3133431 RepID=A0ABU8T0I6_9PSEU